MRIVAVSTWFPTPRAPGVGVFVTKDVAALAAHPAVDRIDVIHLVAPRLIDRATDECSVVVVDGVRVRRVPMHPLKPWDWVRAGRAVQQLTRQADVVHSMAISALPPLVLSRPSVPWLHTEHWSGLTNRETVPLPLRPAIGVASLLLRFPGTVTAVCEYLARPIRRARYPRRTAVVGCVVPPREHVTPRPMRPRAALRLVAVGGLVDRKDPLLAVRVLAELRDRGVAAELTWVGDGPLRRQVQRLARRLRLSDAVTLTGSLDSAGVAEQLDRADMFLLPTRGENFCVSAAEALVAGRPVVVGAAGGQGEYIDERVGRLVTEQTPQAYADAVIALERTTQHLVGDEIAATVGDRFSPANVAAGYVAEYTHLLRSSRARRG